MPQPGDIVVERLTGNRAIVIRVASPEEMICRFGDGRLRSVSPSNLSGHRRRLLRSSRPSSLRSRAGSVRARRPRSLNTPGQRSHGLAPHDRKV